jgi:branched-chain amino acid transport system permease protein
MVRPSVGFFAALVVDGMLAGAIYALVALSFVVVYKTSRVVNFALGEWMLLASGLVAVGVHAGGLGLAGSLLAAGVGVTILTVTFSRVVLPRVIGGPPIALIMVTLGLGALMRGVAAVAFRGLPGTMPVSLPQSAVMLAGVPVRLDRLTVAAIAISCAVVVTLFFHVTRTGVALRAIADDQQVATAVGIDVPHHFAITWAMVGALSLLAGVLWTAVSVGSVGVALVGLKVFPVVILGGLDSVLGAVLGGLVIGVLESLTAGYVDPYLGGGFSTVAAYLVLVLVLCVRPHGLLGRADARRV